MTSDFMQAMEAHAENYAQQDKERESIITQSRNILKNAKQAIYALHRGDQQQWKDKTAAAKKQVDHMQTLAQADQVGAFRAALEEYVEALAFAYILREQQLPTKASLGLEDISTETFLQGLSDCSGELVRKATAAATAGDDSFVLQCMQLVQELQEGFLLFDFRGGELRKKSDSLRHNLAKLEKLNYEVSRK